MYMDSFFWGGGFDILFFLIFTIIIVAVCGWSRSGIGQWNKTTILPRLSVTARVTAKRTNVVRRQHANAGGYDRSPRIPFLLIHQLLCYI